MAHTEGWGRVRPRCYVCGGGTADVRWRVLEALYLCRRCYGYWRAPACARDRKQLQLNRQTTAAAQDAEPDAGAAER
jgi:hypothetical protein